MYYQEVDQGGAGRGKTEWDRDNADGDSNAGWYQGAGAPTRYILCYLCILVTQLFYSPSSFGLPLFPQSAIIGGPGRNVTKTYDKSNVGWRNIRYVFCSFCSPLSSLSSSRSFSGLSYFP